MKWINADKEKPKITRTLENEYATSDDVLCYNARTGMFVARWSEFEGSRKNFWNPAGPHGHYFPVSHWAHIPLDKPKDDE